MILDEIVFNKRREVASLKLGLDIAKAKLRIEKLPVPLPFLSDFKFSLIAEIKKSSPSGGVIVPDFSLKKIAKEYAEGGADALSILTDKKYFQGDIAYLEAAREGSGLPVLRKDFIIDEIQIYESRLFGADAVLLIVRLLSDSQLRSFLQTAKSLRLACLVETRDAKEIGRAISAGAEIIGINNRDLDTLTVDISVTLELMAQFPELKKKRIISESGIANGAQVKELKAAGVSAVLVGESLLRSGDIKGKIKELLST